VVISIRGVTSDEWQEWRLLRRQALDEAPYAFGSTLAEWSGARDSEQRWRQRLEAVPVNLVADQDHSPVGMVSVTGAVRGVVEIISMWVAPSARGRGVGDALIQAALDHARAQGATQVDLGVAPGNGYAITCIGGLGSPTPGRRRAPTGRDQTAAWNSVLSKFLARTQTENRCSQVLGAGQARRAYSKRTGNGGNSPREVEPVETQPNLS